MSWPSHACLSQSKEIKDSLIALFNVVRQEAMGLKDEVSKLGEVRSDWVLYKMTVTQGRVTIMPSTSSLSKVDDLKLKPYKGVRNAKEIHNFLWSLKQYC